VFLDRFQELLFTPLSLLVPHTPPERIQLEEDIVDVLRRETLLLGSLLLCPGLAHWSSLRSVIGFRHQVFAGESLDAWSMFVCAKGAFLLALSPDA
jgi:hypothetical protein